MLTKMFRNAKYCYTTKEVLRMFCSSSKDIVKIGDKCYIPVPCPQQKAPDTVPVQDFSRVTRAEPSKVRFGFLPDEWFLFYQQKTGVSGPYVFLVSVSTFLISKEIYVMEHEYYSMLSIVIMLWLTTVKVGPTVARAIDKGVDEFEHGWTSQRDALKKNLNESIENETKAQLSMDGQLILQDAKRENVALQLEAEYRRRLHNVYKDVKMRLDFQVAQPLILTRFIHKNLIDWIVRQVLAAYTDDKDKQMIDVCINHLTTLSKTAH